MAMHPSEKPLPASAPEPAVEQVKASAAASAIGEHNCNIVGETATDRARLEEALARLGRFYPKLIDLSLERIEALLDKLGNPHLALAPVIHIAGTNGKGSVAAILRALLEAQGKRVQVMTSPHLARIHERIRLGSGELISSAALAAALEECLAANKDTAITYFELLTAAGFVAFSRDKADFCILETGLGGRYDATNVVPRPAATIITGISRDHEDFLGQDLNGIAAEKAGIMKADVPCIIGRQPVESVRSGVIDTFLSQALSTDAMPYLYGKHWTVEPALTRMRFRFGDDAFNLPRPSLQGVHQLYNAGAALAALRVTQGTWPDAENLSTGLGQIDWPGRLQHLIRTPLTKYLSEGWELWVDGAHNENAGAALAEQAKDWASEPGAKPLHLILAMMRRKNPKSFLEPLLPFTESISCIPIPGEPGAFTAQELAACIQPLFPAVRAYDHAEAAIRTAANTEKPGRILVTGSLYIVGKML